MSLTRDEYDCCLNSNSLPKCAALPDQPDQITTPSCKNAMVRHCQTSSNITTPMCRTFIDNLIQNVPPLADMDRQVISFCAMNREASDKFYKECRCVNVENTCLGQKIIRYKAGNPGCYYPPCKEENMFKTSDLLARQCTSITCAIGDITIKGGDGAKIVAPPGMINQNCGNTTLQPPRPSSRYQYTKSSSSRCTGSSLTDKYANTIVAKEDAQNACKDVCDARDDCSAFQTHCASTKCKCQLFSTNGVGVPLIADCMDGSADSLSQGAYEDKCSGKKGMAKDADMWTCSHQRHPPSAAPS